MYADMKSGTGTAASKRTYRMQARAAAAAETGERILRAVLDLHVERFHDQITLEDVADRAGVTVQTVLRRFGSKDALISAAAEHASQQVRSQRMAAPVGDIPAAVDNILDHYDTTGATALRLLAQEDRVPQLKEIANRGREFHYAWVERTFAPFLEGSNGQHRLRAQLIALTDVYTWKLLHLDLGLDRGETKTALIEMIESVIKQGGTQ
jgi:AcrR family transcriptional regulator